MHTGADQGRGLLHLRPACMRVLTRFEGYCTWLLHPVIVDSLPVFLPALTLHASSCLPSLCTPLLAACGYSHCLLSWL